MDEQTDGRMASWLAGWLDDGWREGRGGRTHFHKKYPAAVSVQGKAQCVIVLQRLSVEYVCLPPDCAGMEAGDDTGFEGRAHHAPGQTLLCFVGCTPRDGPHFPI